MRYEIERIQPKIVSSIVYQRRETPKTLDSLIEREIVYQIWKGP